MYCPNGHSCQTGITGNALKREHISWNAPKICRRWNEALPRSCRGPVGKYQRTPTNISNDVRTSPNVYSMAILHSSSELYNLRSAQSPHFDNGFHGIYMTEKKNHVDQPSENSGLTVVRPFNKSFADSFNYRKDRTIKRLSPYDNDFAIEFNRMFKKATVQRMYQTFSCKEMLSIITIL